MSERVEAQRASGLGRPLLHASLLGSWVTAGAVFAGGRVPAWVAGTLLVALLGIIALGVMAQRSGIFARPIVGVRTARPELALTFDDGPDPIYTLPILDALEAHGHRGTFFLVGARAARHPELVEQIVRRGHGLGNHTLRHSYFTTFLDPKVLAHELSQTTALLAATAGHPIRWLRSPVGLLSPRVAEAARLAHLELVAWTATARDGGPWASVERGIARLEPVLLPGSILVLHDGVTARTRHSLALPILLGLFEELRAKGLRSVPIDRLLDPGPPS